MPYPIYLYYKDENKPVRVDTKAKEMELKNLGWTVRYQHKEYPKWVGDKLVQNKDQEDQLLDPQLPDKPAFMPVREAEPEVIKEIRVDNIDTTVIEKPRGPGRPPKKK